MEDKELYEILRNKMQTVVGYLTDCYEEIEKASKKADGLKINEKVYLQDKYDALKEQVLNERDYIKGTIIPEIDRQISEIAKANLESEKTKKE